MEALKGLLGSKKAIAGLAGVVVATLVTLAGKHGYGLDPEAASMLVKAVLGLAGVYILGQGAADIGKEKAKIEAAAVELAMTAHKLELEAFDAEEAAEAAALKILTEDA